MPDTTLRLALPLIAAGQAQKESFHNEALARLDAAVLATVEDVGRDIPPEDPLPGHCWVVGAAPVADWAGQPRALALRTEGGWRYIAPARGMTVRRADTGVEQRFDGTEWLDGELVARRVSIEGRGVVGVQQPAIIPPAGGTTVDLEARTALIAVLNALAAHGLIAT